MDLKRIRSTSRKLFLKYKYAIIVLLIGLVIMLVPSNSNTQKKDNVTTPVSTESENIEKRLEDILKSVNGAGEVRVLLTVSAGEECVYQTDDRGSEDTNNSSTVIITDSERNQSGLIQRKNPPIYRGAVVVCAGADKPEVRLALVDAVRNATGLRSDQISILKMK